MPTPPNPGKYMLFTDSMVFLISSIDWTLVLAAPTPPGIPRNNFGLGLTAAIFSAQDLIVL